MARLIKVFLAPFFAALTAFAIATFEQPLELENGHASNPHTAIVILFYFALMMMKLNDPCPVIDVWRMIVYNLAEFTASTTSCW